jgi:ATP-dependent protease ClpP protease subunit
MSKQVNRFFNVSNTSGSLTLDMYDYIGADMFGDGITEGMVSNALKTSDAKTVTLNINSPGGDAFAGVAIRNVLAQSNKTVKVNVVGLAASAASIIAMAGDTITMHSGSVMMIHPAQAIAMGDAAEMRKMADTLDTVTQSIADVYVAKTGLDKQSVLDMMTAETWMSSDEAVAKGFATGVSKEQAAVKNSYDLSKFRNTPSDLLTEPVEKVNSAQPETEAVTEPVESAFDATSIHKLQLELNKRK